MSRPRPSPRRRRRKDGAAWLLLLGAVALLGVGAFLQGRRGERGPATTTTGAPAPTPFTIPEGFRREDVARKLDAETRLSGATYLELTAAGARGRALAGTSRDTTLEGFLFPATYQIGTATTVADLVDSQVAAFKQRIAGVDLTFARSKNLSMFDVLIIASMVEREARLAADRPIIAGVMYNRLRMRQRLDVDATVQFAVGAWRPLTAADLRSDSPYNTRRFAGLPPGPISSPGLASIEAAANPKQTPYVYYVARDDGTGGHYFATTAAEFDQAVARAAANRARG